ncbi:MAG: Ig-like domain-containing protein [Bacteroidales bacterium]|nr:Ig-like domain-containing protein [Bacteroidales bacterium]
MRSVFAMVAVGLLAMMVWSCKPDAVEVENVKMNSSEAVIVVGNTYKLSAVVTPDAAPQDLVWKSNNTSVATVSGNGLVTAVAVGDCIITVFAGSRSDMCRVTVVERSSDPDNPDDPQDPDDPDDPDDPQDPDNPDDPDNPGGGDSADGFDLNGASNAVFTVAASHTVRFSRGNLQYQASSGTWRFAEHQYDYIGADNANISSEYSGWIDLFGWGTSGCYFGRPAYQPWSSSTTNSDYYPGSNLTGEYANCDWGVYNPISNGGNQAGMWRTLTKAEWNYLLFSRNTVSTLGYDSVRFVKVTVNGTAGLVIFPDNYTHPASITAPTGVNDIRLGFSTNVYTLEQWAMLQNAGCMFLPASGYRQGTSVRNAGTAAHYWSSTYTTSNGAWYLYFLNNDLYVTYNYRYMGQSVRLVMDAD